VQDINEFLDATSDYSFASGEFTAEHLTGLGWDRRVAGQCLAAAWNIDKNSERGM
jgi:hypothetical protein